MTKIKFKSIYSGNQESYGLGHEEELTNSRCPIDDTSLFSARRANGREVYDKTTMYCCPNCGEEYHHIESEKLERSKQITIEERKKDLIKLRAQESHILQFLKAAGEKV